MLIIIGMLAGAVVFTTGFSLGRAHRPRRADAVLKPVCGCRHEKSYHRTGAGPCNYWLSGKAMRCECQVYAGPEPLPEFYAPEIRA